ncbi:MAG: T9SS type A sorting domain-containing protein [Saprospiraceae bacterium]|nr:T9SS type A sorting domain-containing protein [Saprospiraceae bacterium]
MKRHTLVLGILLSGTALSDIWAQKAVLSSGGEALDIRGSVSYSIGQVVYTEQNSQSGIVNAGVQQPLTVMMVGSEVAISDVSLRMYPNPTMDKLVLDLSGDRSVGGVLSYSLHDLFGKPLIQERIQTRSVIVPLDAYTNGMYLLKVSHNNNVIKTFKVIKIN